MLGYYSLTQRRSSQSKTSPTSPSLPFYSSSINEGESPTSPKSFIIPTSPTVERQLTGDGLGSPFSVSNPPYPYQPDTYYSKTSLPSSAEHNQGNMLKSGGSKVPLLARDFGKSGSSRQINGDIKGKGKDTDYAHVSDEHNEDKVNSITSDSFSLLPGDDSSLPKSAVDLPSQREVQNQSSTLFDSSLIPPKSVHDKYVSNHIQPLTSNTGDHPTLEARPSMTRSTSAPGHPSYSATSPPNPTGLLPSAIPSGPGDSTNAQTTQESNQPIYEIFNANLSTEGLAMSKKLRGYLEVVLKGQDQVGKLHLQLEGLGMGNRGIWEVNNREKQEEKEGNDKKDAKELNEKIEERQKGVEDIMQRLGQISDTLRNYHQLGTPKLSFPRQHPHTITSPTSKSPKTPTKVNSNNLGRATTIAGPPSPELKTNVQDRPRAPTLVRSNTAIGELSPNSNSKIKHKSPLINTFTQFSSDDNDNDNGDQDTSPTKKNSNLSPEKLDNTPKPKSKSKSTIFPISPPYKGGNKLPYLDMDKIERNHEYNQEYDNHDRKHHWFGESPDSKSSKRERKITDSPVDLNFSSRW